MIRCHGVSHSVFMCSRVWRELDGSCVENILEGLTKFNGPKIFILAKIFRDMQRVTKICRD